MPSFIEGVDFDTVAREWRCKWNPDDKGTLQKLQALVEKYLLSKATSRFRGSSVVAAMTSKCIIISLEEPLHGDWETAKFAPEAEFLAEAGKIEGLKRIDTQTYTIMPL
eukprot:gene2318-8416_t